MTTTNPTDSKTDPRLADLADRLELAELVSRLGRWIDDKRWDDSASVLAPQVTVATPGGESSGIQAVTEQARRNHEASTTHHMITDVLSDVDGDRAELSANLVVRFGPGGAVGEPTFQAGERYRFEAVRTTAGWRLSHIAIEPRWVIGAPPREPAV